MGKHYTPQAHLRRFEIEEKAGMIWMYDKQTSKFVEAHISKVAQEADFYPEEVERALADIVELPGNICLEKILEHEQLTNVERAQLSLYMMTMATRGPRQRKKSMQLVPGTLEEIYEELHTDIQEWGQKDGTDQSLVARRLAELEHARAKFTTQLPNQITDQIRTPFWSDKTVECIHNMAWHIIPAPAGIRFVTCDTPAHFFEGFGVGTSKSEFTFTISKDFALIGNFKRKPGIVFEKAQPRIAREINRRVLSHAERFVFSSKNEDWIGTVAQKINPRLNVINWI